MANIPREFYFCEKLPYQAYVHLTLNVLILVF